MTESPGPPAELIEYLNRGDCVLFVGDALIGRAEEDDDSDGIREADCFRALVEEGW